MNKDFGNRWKNVKLNLSQDEKKNLSDANNEKTSVNSVVKQTKDKGEFTLIIQLFCHKL